MVSNKLLFECFLFAVCMVVSGYMNRRLEDTGIFESNDNFR